MSKKCTKYSTSDLMFYIRGKMSREEELELQHHLLSCEECLSELESLRSAVGSIEECVATPATVSLKRIYLAAASIAAVIIGGVLILPNWGEDNGTAVSPVIYNPTPVYNSTGEVKAKQDTSILDTIKKDSIKIEVK